MEMLILFALQLIAIGAGFALMWRRMGALQSEVARLRQALEERRGAARSKLLAVAAGAPATTSDAPMARAARAWRKSEASPPAPALAEDQKGLLLAALGFAPALAFAFKLEPIAIVSCGVALAAGMAVAGLHAAWRRAAWAGVVTLGAWTLAAFVLGAAQLHPLAASFTLAGAALSGLVQAYFARLAPGAALAFIASAALIAMGAQIGMVGAPGLAFAAVVVAAALAGGARLRLEPVFVAAFGAALVGLFVLSGQAQAAIWFTPAAAWMGALFLGVAAVGAPRLGARAAALAGVGTLAPFVAIAALYGAQHGLADRFAAGGAFLALALILSGLIGLSATKRGFGALKLTLWVLATGAFASLAAAVAVTAPPPLAVTALVSASLGLLALDARLEHALWRTLACTSVGLALGYAGVSAAGLLTEAETGWLNIALAFAAPAALAGAAAYLARRRGHTLTAGVLECAAFMLGIGGASLVTRLAFSASAPLIQPIGVAEAATHVCAWLAGALLIGARAGALRKFTAAGFWFASLCACFAIGFWSLAEARREPALAIADFNALTLSGPALLFVLHWRFWRARSANIVARVSLGAASLLAAAALIIEVIKARPVPEGADWVGAVTGLVAFALAAAVTFAPGAVAAAPTARAKPASERTRIRKAR